MNYIDQWKANRTELKQLKTETHAIEIIIDQHAGFGPHRIQASRDIRTYGIYEAVLYLDRHLDDNAQDALRAELLTLFNREVNAINKTGK